MSALYRKKPLPVEARQLLGSEDGQAGRDLADWCGGSVGGAFTDPRVLVPTLEGDLVARCGDWIVKGPREEFWPVKGSIFAETYEDADTPLHAVTDARAAIHAMFPLDEAATAELDARLDALVAEELRAAATDLELRARSGGTRQRGLTFARALLRSRADGITPAAPRRNIRHREVAETLRANPGEWAPVGVYAGVQSAHTISRLIRGGSGPVIAYRPAGSFQARMERGSDGVRVFARYVGDGGGSRG